MTRRLKDFITVGRKLLRRKVRKRSSILPNRNGPTRATIPSAELGRPPAALPFHELYPAGLNGGWMIWLEVKDNRAKRAKKRYVCLELKAPTDERDFWYPVKPTLSSIEAAAVLGIALGTFYRISPHFTSKRDRGRGQVYFMTDEMYDHDVPRIEEFVERYEARKGRRPGKHAAGCLDHDHDGPCNVEPPKRKDIRTGSRRAKPSSGWKLEGTKSKYTVCAPDAPPPERAADTSARQTFTEATINAMTTSRTAAPPHLSFVLTPRQVPHGNGCRERIATSSPAPPDSPILLLHRAHRPVQLRRARDAG